MSALIDYAEAKRPSILQLDHWGHTITEIAWFLYVQDGIPISRRFRRRPRPYKLLALARAVNRVIRDRGVAFWQCGDDSEGRRKTRVRRLGKS